MVIDQRVEPPTVQTNNDKRKIIGAWDEILAMGDASGSVSLWRVAGGIVKPQHFILNAVDSSQDLSVSESVEFRFDTGLAPWATAKVSLSLTPACTVVFLSHHIIIIKLADGWKGLSDSTSAVVSASLIVEDTLLLVRGYDNGDISIAGLPSQDGPPRVIRRAHSSRVTSLISYETTTAHLLISAGADSVIKVWNLVYVLPPPFPPSHRHVRLLTSVVYRTQDRRAGARLLAARRCGHTSHTARDEVLPPPNHQRLAWRPKTAHTPHQQGRSEDFSGRRRFHLGVEGQVGWPLLAGQYELVPPLLFALLCFATEPEER